VGVVATPQLSLRKIRSHTVRALPMIDCMSCLRGWCRCQCFGDCCSLYRWCTGSDVHRLNLPLYKGKDRWGILRHTPADYTFKAMTMKANDHDSRAFLVYSNTQFMKELWMLYYTLWLWWRRSIGFRRCIFGLLPISCRGLRQSSYSLLSNLSEIILSPTNTVNMHQE